MVHPSFASFKILSPKEMECVEKLALKQEFREELFIQEAGKKAAERIINSPLKRATLLVGKGNKGADAYAAGLALMEEGFHVEAIALFPPKVCSLENQNFRDRFAKRGSIIEAWDGDPIEMKQGWIIDGMLGTGFQGKVEGLLETAIRIANDSKLPILAIDLPSGLNGATGEVGSVAIQATMTAAMGFAKIGCFLREGWNHTGSLSVEDFGLPAVFIGKAEAICQLPDLKAFALPKIVRNRHKYQAGYVLGFSGSNTMRGAPKMAGLAAMRAGAGIVRIFHKGEIGSSPMELICQKWNAKIWAQECKRAQAIFAGPGLGIGQSNWLKKIDLPIVLDADLLRPNMLFPKKAVLTPHRGEMLRLLKLQSAPLEEEFLARCQKFTEKNRVVLLLKGAPTFLFAHGKLPLIIPYGDPGMATAGSGDVLTGIIAALLAQGLSSYEAAALGAILHGIAGEKAARAKTSYSLIARDLIECLPKAYQEFLGNCGL